MLVITQCVFNKQGTIIITGHFTLVIPFLPSVCVYLCHQIQFVKDHTKEVRDPAFMTQYGIFDHICRMYGLSLAWGIKCVINMAHGLLATQAQEIVTARSFILNMSVLNVTNKSKVATIIHVPKCIYMCDILCHILQVL